MEDFVIEGDTYCVHTAKGLQAWANACETGEWNCALMDNIDMTGIEWKPVGAGSRRYAKHFEGGGRFISNLSVNAASNDTAVAGLFGALDWDAVVQNLTLIGGFICAGTKGKYVFAGSVAGDNFGTILNCNVCRAFISADAESAYIYAGGVAGSNHGRIFNCAAIGTMRADGSHARVGGIAESNYGGIVSGCSSIIEKTHASAKESAYYGGIVACNEGAVFGCTASSDKITATGFYAHAGGIAGVNHCAVSNCLSSGNLSAKGTTADGSAGAYAGGVVGWNLKGTVASCTAVGDVSVEGVYVRTAGGIAGWNDGGKIQNCCNNGLNSNDEGVGVAELPATDNEEYDAEESI